MKLVYIGILKNEAKPAVQLCLEEKLDSYGYFTRTTVAQFLEFSAATIAERTSPGMRRQVTEKGHVTYAFARTEGICGIVITDEEYPSGVAQGLLSKVCDEFVTKYPRSAYATATKDSSKLSFPELNDYIQKYQDPQQADSIMKIQKELDETKVVINKTIESVLERGEKIETLVAKSDGLSAQSKMFYTQAKKQNSCCIVM